MVPVTNRVTDVGGMAIGLNDSRQHIDSCENFQRSIYCGPSNPTSHRTHVGNELLGGKGLAIAQHSFHDSYAGPGQAIAMVHQQVFDVLLGERCR